MVDVVHPSLFDTTAASNLAARGNSVAENWLPSVVNNWGRALMSLIAGLYDDLSGQNTVAGTANAITVTGNVPLTALAEGVIVAWQNSSGPNTAAATLAVDGLTAKAIRLQGDLALIGGELLDDGIYLVRYDASANGAAGAWILLNPNAPMGIYTPTLTNTTNLDASTASSCNYFVIQSGSARYVTVFGSVTLDPTAAAATTLSMSLPIASDLAALGDLGGVGAATGFNEAWSITADTTANLAFFRTVAVTTTNHALGFSFTYRIL